MQLLVLHYPFERQLSCSIAFRIVIWCHPYSVLVAYMVHLILGRLSSLAWLRLQTKYTFISIFQWNPTLWTYHGTLNVVFLSSSVWNAPKVLKLAFYVLYANVVVKTWKCHEQRCRLMYWTSTGWSILQGRKIINVLCCGCRILLCTDSLRVPTVFSRRVTFGVTNWVVLDN